MRGVDFTEDPLLQGRIFSYLDTQLNRHGGPNFEQIPINRPVVPIHNNNRDGAAQNLVHKNIIHCKFHHSVAMIPKFESTRPRHLRPRLIRLQDSPNTLNGGYPQQATQNTGRGYFNAPSRGTSGRLVRGLPPSFDDHWSQVRLFYNSLTAAEQQFLINAIRFETSHLQSAAVKQNVLTQLNRVSNDVAARVATALGLEAPAPDATYYHDNTTAGISITNETLPTVATLTVGILATTKNGNGTSAMSQAAALKERLTAEGLVPTVVAESLAAGVDKTYSAADATDFDAVVVTSGADAAGLFSLSATGGLSPLYPPLRPLQVASSAFLFGKPVAYYGGAAPSDALVAAGLDPRADGMYASADMETLATGVVDGLKTYKFTARYPLDP